MENIQFEEIVDVSSSNYIRPLRCRFTQDGRLRTWDVVRSHDSVASVLYHRAKNSLVFVRQFRPAVYVSRALSLESDLKNVDFKKYPVSSGFTYELCAGIVDKKKSLAEIMKEEILEECGYDVETEKIEQIVKFRGSVGLSGNQQTLFYAEIDEKMRVKNCGGGNIHEDEMIEVLYLPLDQCASMLFDEKIEKGPGLMFAVMWFLHTKFQTLSKSHAFA